MNVGHITRAGSSNPAHPPRLRNYWFIVALLLMAAGCPSRSGPPTTVTGPRPDAQELWQRLQKTYQQAKSYRDDGVVRLTYRQDGQPVRDEQEVAVELVRPQKIRVKAYQATVASNEKELRARIRDEVTHNVDNQAVVRSAPPEVTLAELLGDTLLQAQLGNGAIEPLALRHPIQLELLLSPQPCDGLFTSAKARLGEDLVVDDRPCYQLILETKFGDFVFAVDPKSSVVRRLQYPRDVILDAMRKAGDISDIQLVAEFRNAQINSAIADETFDLQIPADAKRVNFFVPPPLVLSSELLGQPVKAFSLHDPQGGRVTPETLAGKTAILLWFADHPACESSVRQLDQVREKFADNDQLVFHAVCTEPSAVSNDQLAQLLNRWQSQLPLLRDLEAHGRDLLQIVQAPALVVLNPRGVVQIFDVGGNSQLSNQLPTVLDKIVNGEDVAATFVAQHLAEQKQYAQQLAIAANATSSQLVEIPVTPMKPRNDPKHLKLTKLWTNDTTKNPGNFHVIPADDAAPSRLFVLSDARIVVEFNDAGNIVTSKELAATNSELFSVIRSGRLKDKQRVFAASGQPGSQVSFFDEHWQPLFRYPATDQPHSGIRDVQFADLDGDGVDEIYVGFWTTLGIHRVSPTGDREWSSRAAGTVLSLTATPPDEIGWRKLLVGGELGRVIRMSQFGEPYSPVRVANWNVSQLFAARFAKQGASNFCGIAYSTTGDLVAVALDGELKEQWNYPLPPGLHRVPVELVSSGPLLENEPPFWTLAGPDGSIHLIRDDGEFSDYFQLGEPIQGLAITTLANQHAIIVSTPTSFTAFQVAR